MAITLIRCVCSLRPVMLSLYSFRCVFEILLAPRFAKISFIYICLWLCVSMYKLFFHGVTPSSSSWTPSLSSSLSLACRTSAGNACTSMPWTRRLSFSWSSCVGCELIMRSMKTRWTHFGLHKSFPKIVLLVWCSTDFT